MFLLSGSRSSSTAHRTRSQAYYKQGHPTCQTINYRSDCFPFCRITETQTVGLLDIKKSESQAVKLRGVIRYSRVGIRWRPKERRNKTRKSAKLDESIDTHHFTVSRILGPRKKQLAHTRGAALRPWRSPHVHCMCDHEHLPSIPITRQSGERIPSSIESRGKSDQEGQGARESR